LKNALARAMSSGEPEHSSLVGPCKRHFCGPEELASCECTGLFAVEDSCDNVGSEICKAREPDDMPVAVWRSDVLRVTSDKQLLPSRLCLEQQHDQTTITLHRLLVPTVNDQSDLAATAARPGGNFERMSGLK
jgi:hypothetical protein